MRNTRTAISHALIDASVSAVDNGVTMLRDILAVHPRISGAELVEALADYADRLRKAVPGDA